MTQPRQHTDRQIWMLPHKTDALQQLHQIDSLLAQLAHDADNGQTPTARRSRIQQIRNHVTDLAKHVASNLRSK